MKKTALFFVGAAILLALSFLLDKPVHDFVFAHRDGWPLKTSHWVTRYGDWISLMLACVPFLLVAFYYHNEKWKRLLITMMIVSSLAGLSADVIRAATGRTRPNSHAQITPGWYGVKDGSRWVITDSRYSSFPSGHTAAAMGLIAPLFLLRSRFRWLLLPVPVVIAISRLVVNAHHCSDVVAATLLAFAVAAWWLRYGSSFMPDALKPPLPLVE